MLHLCTEASHCLTRASTVRMHVSSFEFIYLRNQRPSVQNIQSNATNVTAYEKYIMAIAIYLVLKRFHVKAMNSRKNTRFSEINVQYSS